MCLTVRKSGLKDFCFIRDIENYQKVFNDCHELMRKAKEEIEKCEALLIDYDGPGNGRIVELGIAFALNKKIFIITKKGTKVKDTIAGVADQIIEYENLDDIVEPLRKLSPI